ncbi:hypothetical protein T06_11496 [Trichinella sp. T6]|nr:hypothetical protein T06_11496 [Trichinella sp. T6]
MPLLNRRNCRLCSNFPKQEKVLRLRLSAGRTIRLFYSNMSLLSHSYADIGYCYCKITEY